MNNNISTRYPVRMKTYRERVREHDSELFINGMVTGTVLAATGVLVGVLVGVFFHL